MLRTVRWDVRALLLGWGSRPAEHRVLYRAVVRRRPSHIVELGFADRRRSERLIRLAQRLSRQNAPIGYTLVDPFDGAEGISEPLRIKDAYRWFAIDGVRPRLIPGPIDAALRSYANRLGKADLVILSAATAAEMAQGWFYLPRILAEDAVVFQQDAATGRFSLLPPAAIAQRGRRAQVGRRPAA